MFFSEADNKPYTSMQTAKPKETSQMYCLPSNLNYHDCNSRLPQVRKWSGKTEILQGQGKVREFYSGSGKIGILKKSQGKLKL